MAAMDDRMFRAEEVEGGRSGLKIVVVGNQAGYGYRLCTWLHSVNESADLIQFKLKDIDQRAAIESVDRDFASKPQPAWLHEYGRYDHRLHDLSQYDVAITIGTTGLKAAKQIGGIPIAHMAQGSDVFDYPFRYVPPQNRIVAEWDRVKFRYLKDEQSRAARITALEVRGGLANCDIVVADFRVVVRSLKQLGLVSKLRVWGAPEDVEGNQLRVDREMLADLTAKYQSYDRVLLWLSRLNMVDRNNPHYKGVEMFLDAFARLVQGGANVRAVIGEHGQDVSEFRRKVELLGLSERIDFVSHLPLWQLLTYMSMDRAIVVDTLSPAVDTFGGLTREALSIGSVMVRNVDQDLISLCYGAPAPLHLADSADTCFAQLQHLTQLSLDDFQRLRSEVLAWARTRLDYRVGLGGLLRLLGELRYVKNCQ